MPELPEVETVRRTLKNFIIGRPILGIDVYYSRIIVGDVKQFIEAFTGEVFCDIDRVGKYLIFQCQEHAFVSHLRMEGKFHIVDQDEPVNKHTHVVFHMDHHQDLRYIDTRKFGRMECVDLHHYREQMPLKKLGPEPFDITVEDLYQRLHHCSLPIKTALLDQSIMSRAGQALRHRDEQVGPRRKGHPHRREVREEVERGPQIHGLFQVQLKVHGQKECSVCHHPIKKVMVHQRGTYFCPHCQKKRY